MITMRDIAEEANVSRTAVSAVLNGNNQVRDLPYLPLLMRRCLRNGKNFPPSSAVQHCPVRPGISGGLEGVQSAL